jgi:hypothetical protein
MVVSTFFSQHEGSGRKYGIVGVVGVVATLLFVGVLRSAIGGTSKSRKADNFLAKPAPSDSKSDAGLDSPSPPIQQFPAKSGERQQGWFVVGDRLDK